MHKEIKLEKKHLEINSCCYLLFEEILLFKQKTQQSCRLWIKYFWNDKCLEININVYLTLSALEKILTVCSYSNNNKLKKSYEIKPMNNCSQAMFSDGETER